MTAKEILAEIRKNPVGKEILTRVYGVRRGISAEIHRNVERIIAPDDDMLCFALVMGCQNMGLEIGTFVEFAPLGGMLGPCKLSGTSLPVFEYKVFHAQLVMEFIKVRVEVARPDRIHFTAHIDSAGTADPKDDGKEMEIIEAYRKPFYLLANHLYNYFPHYQSPACRVLQASESNEYNKYASESNEYNKYASESNEYNIYASESNEYNIYNREIPQGGSKWGEISQGGSKWGCLKR